MNEPPIRPHDLRLVPAAAAGWSATLAGILCGSRVMLVVVAVCVGSAVVIVCAGDCLGTWMFGLLAAVVVGGCYSGAAALHLTAVETSPVSAAAEQRAWASAAVVVREDPRRVRFAGPDTVVVKADLTRIDIGGETVRVGGRVQVFAPAEGWEHVIPGQSLALRGRMSVPDRADLTVAVIRTRLPPLQVDPPSHVARAASAVRIDLAAAASDALPADQAGLLPGLVVGDVSALDETVESNFRAAGLTHLTAVSGANFAILLGAVLLITRAIGIGPWTTVCLCAVVMLAFVVIARPSPSVLRAAVMGAIGLIALVTGRRRQAVPAVCTAVLGLLLWWPELAVDFGFALSVSATAGLVVLAPVWVDWLRARGWGRGPAEVVAVSAAAHAVTAPIVAGMTGTFSMVGIVANIAVAPVVAPITVVGAAAAVIAPASGLLASLVLELSSAPVWWLISVARWSASAPGAGIDTPDGPLGAFAVVAVLGGIVVALRISMVRWMLTGLCAGVLVVWIGSILW